MIKILKETQITFNGTRTCTFVVTTFYTTHAASKHTNIMKVTLHPNKILRKIIFLKKGKPSSPKGA